MRVIDEENCTDEQKEKIAQTEKIVLALHAVCKEQDVVIVLSAMGNLLAHQADSTDMLQKMVKVVALAAFGAFKYTNCSDGETKH